MNKKFFTGKLAENRRSFKNIRFLAGFTPLEKATDFSRRLSSDKADGGLKPPSALTVREQSSLTGFTMLEAMVVMLIMTVIMAALFITMSSGKTSWSSADTDISLQQDLRRAILYMTGEIRQSGATQISCPADGNPCPAVSFNVSSGILGTGIINWSTDTISYALSGGQIIRSQSGDTKVLANNVTNLIFVRQPTSSRVVDVNVTAQRQTQFDRIMNASVSSSVTLRN